MPHHPSLRRPARGLTFIELMFATMILGLGMIIIASVFPVAISEQRATIDESAVSALERSAIRTLDAAAAVKGAQTPWLQQTDLNAPATWAGGGALRDRVRSFGEQPALWNRISGDLVNKADPRYAWTAMYIRQPDTPGGPDNDQVVFIVATLVSRDAAGFDGSSATALEKLQPGKVKITYYYKGSQDPGLANDPEDDTIKIEDEAAEPGDYSLAAVEGAYIVRGDNVQARRFEPGPPATWVANELFPSNAIIKLGTQFDPDPSKGEVKAADGARRFRVAPGFGLIGVGAVNNAPAWAIGADITSSSSSNRAMSCRAITVIIPDPG